jgi:hypothetical protein
LREGEEVKEGYRKRKGWRTMTGRTRDGRGEVGIKFTNMFKSKD